MILSERKSLTISEIAKDVLLENSRLSRIAQVLEDKGIIRRDKCSDDQRYIRLELTKDGEELSPVKQDTSAPVVTRNACSPTVNGSTRMCWPLSPTASMSFPCRSCCGPGFGMTAPVLANSANWSPDCWCEATRPWTPEGNPASCSMCKPSVTWSPSIRIYMH